ncbi:MAG: hypothetical protein KBD67_06890 [Anaerolineaceae bacterium]|nr:hypothetical protein [Anaerolineaceae bacterium]
MKTKKLMTIVVVTVLAILVLAACSSAPPTAESTPAPTQTPYVVVVTATPQPVTETAAPTEETVAATKEIPTEESPSDGGDGDTEAPKFFRDEFEGNLDNYNLMLWTGRFGKTDVFIEDARLKFRLNAIYLAPYLVYTPHTYTDVRLEVLTENLAVNENHMTLVCRYDEDRGWYEFNIGSDGLFRINYYDAKVLKNYVRLWNGGSNDINLGRQFNKITAECVGSQLSLYVNDVLLKTVEHKDLREGRVGLGVSSFSSTPVQVDFDYFDISQP